VESEPEDEPVQAPPLQELTPPRSPSPKTIIPSEAPRADSPPPIQYQPYRKPDEPYEPKPVPQAGSHRHKKPSFLAHLVGPKDGFKETRPPRYHPDRDYLKEFGEGDGVGRPVRRKHDDEWLDGFLKDVAGEARDRR